MEEFHGLATLTASAATGPRTVQPPITSVFSRAQVASLSSPEIAVLLSRSSAKPPLPDGSLTMSGSVPVDASSTALSAELILHFKNKQCMESFKQFVLCRHETSNADSMSLFFEFIRESGSDDPFGAQFYADLSSFEVKVSDDGFCGYQVLTAVVMSILQRDAFAPMNLRFDTNVPRFLAALQDLRRITSNECRDSQLTHVASRAYHTVLSQLESTITVVENQFARNIESQNPHGLPVIGEKHWLDIGEAIGFGLLSSFAPVILWRKSDTLSRCEEKHSHLYLLHCCNRFTNSRSQDGSSNILPLFKALLAAEGSFHILQCVRHFNILRSTVSAKIATFLRASIESLISAIRVSDAPAPQPATPTKERQM